MLTIAIIGKPNVGKTTLFNKITGTLSGITMDTPGITRDRNELILNNFILPVKLIDTAGLEIYDKDVKSDIEFNMKKQTLIAIDKSDLIFFILDGSIEITNYDMEIINLLKKSNKDFIILVNKVDKKSFNISKILNIGELIEISAEHNIGLNLIKKKIKEYIDDNYNKFIEDEKKESKSIKIAAIGRPNAGKSTIINKILTEDRLIVDSVAGTTRDSIAVCFNYKDYNMNIIDTAGIRKRKSINDEIEELSVEKSFHSIDKSDVILLIMDIENALESQDLILATKTIELNKILILCFNKWDKVSSEINEQLLVNINNKIKSTMPLIKKMPFFILSAIKEDDMSNLLNEVIYLYEKSLIKFKTKNLNELVSDKEIMLKFPYKIKYITQVNVKPQIFILHLKTRKINDIKDDQLANIRNIIAERLKLEDIPIVIKLKSGSIS